MLGNRLQSTCGFDGVRKGIYFGGEPIRRTEVELRMERMRSQGGGLDLEAV